MYQQNQTYQIKSFKEKMTETSNKLAITHAFYLPSIFMAVASLYISFAFLAWDFCWHSDVVRLEIFYDNLFEVLRITMSVLSVPLIAGCILRVIFMVNLASAINELGRTYPFVYYKTKRISTSLRVGVILEVAAAFVLPLIGNFGGAIVVLLAYNQLYEVLTDLKKNGLYNGSTEKSLFNSYLIIVGVFTGVSIISLLIMYGTPYVGAQNYIFAILPLVVLLAGTIWHGVAFFKFVKDLRLLKDPSPQEIAAAQQFVLPGYVPYTPQAQYAPPQQAHHPPPQQQVQYVQPPPKQPADQEEFGSFCANCGARLKKAAKFCPTCGTEK